MSELILPAEFFATEPIKRTIKYPGNFELDVLLMPVTGDIDSEYQKLKGHDQQTLRFKPGENSEGPRFEFEPIERVFSNEREIKANKWLAKKIIKGFPNGFKAKDGREVECTEKNLESLACLAWFIQPIFREAYSLMNLKTEIEEGN